MAAAERRRSQRVLRKDGVLLGIISTANGRSDRSPTKRSPCLRISLPMVDLNAQVEEAEPRLPRRQPAGSELRRHARTRPRRRHHPDRVQPTGHARIFLNFFANGFYAAAVETPANRSTSGPSRFSPSHHPADRRGRRSRSVDHLRHRHALQAWRQHRRGHRSRRIQRIHDAAAAQAVSAYAEGMCNSSR